MRYWCITVTEEDKRDNETSINPDAVPSEEIKRVLGWNVKC